MDSFSTAYNRLSPSTESITMEYLQLCSTYFFLRAEDENEGKKIKLERKTSSGIKLLTLTLNQK